MLDSGATASAGPQASVERLFQCLQKVDHKATLELNHAKRPYFRYGSGKWNRALCEVSLSSQFSGSLRSFKVFALPILQNFMSHGLMQQFCFHGVGMIIDFND